MGYLAQHGVVTKILGLAVYCSKLSSLWLVIKTYTIFKDRSGLWLFVS